MNNYFTRGGQAAKEVVRTRVLRQAAKGAPVSAALADWLGLQTAEGRPNRRLRRAGLTYLREPLTSRITRHTICRGCDRRTWTDVARWCRKCLVAGKDLEAFD